jgi:hypothetical protein
VFSRQYQWQMSFGILIRVGVVRSDVSGERIDYIFRVNGTLDIFPARSEDIPQGGPRRETLSRHLTAEIYRYRRVVYLPLFRWMCPKRYLPLIPLWKNIRRKCSATLFIIPLSINYIKIHSKALIPKANYTDWTTATCRRNLVPTFADRGVLCGQRGGSPTVVNLRFLDRSRYFSFK